MILDVEAFIEGPLFIIFVCLLFLCFSVHHRLCCAASSSRLKKEGLQGVSKGEWRTAWSAKGGRPGKGL
jgi:hypothetical protein